MEEIIQSENNVELADPQQTEPQFETQETSVNPSEVADPKPVQDAETNAHYAEQRRKQELEQYRSQAETYQQQLDRVARVAGYETHEEMVRYLDQIEQEQQQQRYRDAGIDPETFNQFLEQHPDIQYAKQMKQKADEQQRFETEANELFAEFPDLKPDQIQPEVWQMKEQKGLSLLDSYLRVNFKSLSQQKEQEAIKKLQGNAQSSTGSLGGGDVQHNTSVKDMSKDDFESFVRKVKNGEARGL